MLIGLLIHQVRLNFMYIYKVELPWGHTVQLDSYNKFEFFKFRSNKINKKQWEWIFDVGWWRIFVTNA